MVELIIKYKLSDISEECMECINENCPCKRTNCERHGDCVACKEHHHSLEQKLMTSCERIKVKEEKLKKKVKAKD